MSHKFDCIYYSIIEIMLNCIIQGMSPRQVSREYREQEQRTLIGFGLYFKNTNGDIDSINIDLVSNNQGQSGYDTVNAFRLVFFI